MYRLSIAWSRIAMVLLVLTAYIPAMHAWVGMVVDGDTQLPLSGVRIQIFVGDPMVMTAETVSEPSGKISLADSIISCASKIEFTKEGYAPKDFQATIPPEHIELRQERVLKLGEVVVSASSNTYAIRRGTLIYEVSRDSLMLKRSAWDALRRTPMLIIGAKGDISAIPGYSGIEFRMNGLRDAMFADGTFLRPALESIPASLVDKVEVTIRTTPQGEVLEVNFVTKARIEGIAGQISSAISDASWANTLYGITKVKRLALSASYMNSWNWNHSSVQRSDEYRFDSPDLYRYESENRDKGYKADIHRYKVYGMYDIDDQSCVTLDAMMFRKTDPHTNMIGRGTVTTMSGLNALHYGAVHESRAALDAEYDIYLSYQKKFGRKGHTYAVYNFYSRPLRMVTSTDYDVTISPGTDAEQYNGFLYNTYHMTKNRYVTHTLQWEWEKLLSRRSILSLEAKGRWLTDNLAGYQKLEDAIVEGVPTDEIFTDSRHSQGSVFTQAFFRYFGNNYEIQPGVILQGYYDLQKLPFISERYRYDYLHVLPALKYLWQPKSMLIFSVTYDMHKRVPSVKVLNPVEDRSVPGTVSYGNPTLSPETAQRLNMSMTFTKGRWMVRLTSANRYSTNLILAHDFLGEDNLKHITYSNAAKCLENTVSLYLNGRLRRLSMSAFVSANYVDYDACHGIAGGNHGWYLNTNASMEYSAPGDWYFRLSGNFHTSRIYFQSNGNRDFGYALSVSRSFLRNRLMVELDGSSIIPVHYTRHRETFAPGYRSVEDYRYYHASFSLRLTYKFGSLKAKIKNNNISVTNNDIKSTYSE